MLGRGLGEVRSAAACAVARVLSGEAEAHVHKGAGGAVDGGERGRHAAVGSALRRAEPEREVHEYGSQEFQGGGEDGGVEVLTGI